MIETFEPPYYLRRSIEVNYSQFTAEWNITGKSQPSYSDVNAYMTYGTDRANAYKILEDTLNLRDVRIYDTRTDPDVTTISLAPAPTSRTHATCQRRSCATYSYLYGRCKI